MRHLAIVLAVLLGAVPAAQATRNAYAVFWSAETTNQQAMTDFIACFIGATNLNDFVGSYTMDPVQFGGVYTLISPPPRMICYPDDDMPNNDCPNGGIAGQTLLRRLVAAGEVHQPGPHDLFIFFFPHATTLGNFGFQNSPPNFVTLGVNSLNHGWTVGGVPFVGVYAPYRSFDLTGIPTALDRATKLLSHEITEALSMALDGDPCDWRQAYFSRLQCRSGSYLVQAFTPAGTRVAQDSSGNWYCPGASWDQCCSARMSPVADTDPRILCSDTAAHRLQPTCVGAKDYYCPYHLTEITDCRAASCASDGRGEVCRVQTTASSALVSLAFDNYTLTSWPQDQTMLGTVDGKASPLASPQWQSSSLAVAPDATADPEQLARFALPLLAPEVASETVVRSQVQPLVAGLPVSIPVTVEMTAYPHPTVGGGGGGGGGGGTLDDQGCAVATRGRPAAPLVALLLLVAQLARPRRRPPQ